MTRAIVVSAIVASLVVACATTAPEQLPAQASVPMLKPGVPAGYLGRDLPDSLALLPAPPAAVSAAFAQDEAIHEISQTLRDGPRGVLATSDADLAFPHAASTYSCALGVQVSQSLTPRLYLLLQRSMVDAGLATYKAKTHYQHERPFVHYNEHTCYAPDEASLRKDGSYPSGHTAVGWTWGLLLVEIAPERTDALLARARSFGESRLVCNAHWQSDIVAGRTIAAATVARLHADPTFIADLAAARKEVREVKAGEGDDVSNADAAQDCAAQASQLAPIPGAL